MGVQFADTLSTQFPPGRIAPDRRSFGSTMARRWIPPAQPQGSISFSSEGDEVGQALA